MRVRAVVDLVVIIFKSIKKLKERESGLGCSSVEQVEHLFTLNEILIPRTERKKGNLPLRVCTSALHE